MIQGKQGGSYARGAENNVAGVSHHSPMSVYETGQTTTIQFGQDPSCPDPGRCQVCAQPWGEETHKHGSIGSSAGFSFSGEEWLIKRRKQHLKTSKSSCFTYYFSLPL